jgi:putative hydrolase of the HAD superfamily
MKPAILFDLGNTLVEYYRAEQFRPVLETAIAAVLDELKSRDLTQLTLEAAICAAVQENREAADFRFSPMAERFARIFGTSFAHDSSVARALCERFLRPIFASGRLYSDTLPVLQELNSDGYQTAIVSNAPWGSPPEMWRQELARLGLADAVDCIVLCGDVGWRKPAPQIFNHAAARLRRQPNECVFVGDDLRWDIAGSAAVGMHPILMDRDDTHRDHIGDRVSDLRGVLSAVVGRR